MYTTWASAAMKYPRFSKLEMPVISEIKWRRTMCHPKFLIKCFHLRRNVGIIVLGATSFL
jgi:hypothetical protein